MVTHDLRMTKYVDKVVQMVDGKIARVITERADIELLSGTSEFDRLDTATPIKPDGQIIPKTLFQQAPIPVFGGAD
jgi:hypothetical protein